MRLKKRNHSLPGTGKDERQGHKKTGMIDFKSLISVFIYAVISAQIVLTAIFILL